MIKVLTSNTLAYLIKQANDLGIKREEIIQLSKVGELFALIYEKND